MYDQKIEIDVSYSGKAQRLSTPLPRARKTIFGRILKYSIDGRKYYDADSRNVRKVLVEPAKVAV